MGDAQSLLTLDFPLIKELKMKDVIFDVQSDVSSLNIPVLSDNLAISDGDMKLSVNREGINSNGSIILNDVEFAAEWQEDFTKTKEFPTTYILSGDIEGAQWDNLFLPFEPYVDGAAHANLTLHGRGSGLKTGAGNFDLKDTTVEFEPLGWVKEKTNSADTEFTLRFDDNGIINVNDIKFKSDNMNSELSLIYDGERASRLYIKSLLMADNDFTGLFEWDPKAGLYDVSIKGDRFNAQPMMDIVFAPHVEGDEADLPNFNLSGSVGNVSMYNDVLMQDTTILTGYNDNKVVDFGYSGNWDEDKNMSILIASMDEDLTIPQKLTLKTNDAGRALRSLDFFTSGDKGDLLVTADMKPMEKGYSLKGTIEAGHFNVANSKAFSELLKEKEFAKAQEELEENGLSFASFKSEFTQYDEVLTIISGSATGPSIGVTLDGYIDSKFDEISLGGTIIPAYGLNSLLSNIPLIGTILAGGKGEGVFAATFNMTGTVEDPNVSINPLMALAPGIFRKIFGAIGGGGSNEPTAREEAEEIEQTEKNIEDPVEATPPETVQPN